MSITKLGKDQEIKLVNSGMQPVNRPCVPIKRKSQKSPIIPPRPTDDALKTEVIRRVDALEGPPSQTK